jgi:hypothetical protein
MFLDAEGDSMGVIGVQGNDKLKFELSRTRRQAVRARG